MVSSQYCQLFSPSFLYPIYPRPNSLKTIPFTAAHTYIGYIWKYPLPPGSTFIPQNYEEQFFYYIVTVFTRKSAAAPNFSLCVTCRNRTLNSFRFKTLLLQQFTFIYTRFLTQFHLHVQLVLQIWRCTSRNTARYFRVLFINK